MGGICDDFWVTYCFWPPVWALHDNSAARSTWGMRSPPANECRQFVDRRIVSPTRVAVWAAWAQIRAKTEVCQNANLAAWPSHARPIRQTGEPAIEHAGEHDFIIVPSPSICGHSYSIRASRAHIDHLWEIPRKTASRLGRLWTLARLSPVIGLTNYGGGR